MSKLDIIPVAFFLAFTALAANSLAVEIGPAEIVLRSSVDPAPKAKLAFFPHAIHQGNFECATCHHSKDKDGKMVAYTEGMEIAKCESCHNKTSAMPAKLNTFKNAAHALCKGCHTERTKEGKNAGPTKCNGCHQKDLE